MLSTIFIYSLLWSNVVYHSTNHNDHYLLFSTLCNNIVLLLRTRTCLYTLKLRKLREHSLVSYACITSLRMGVRLYVVFYDVLQRQHVLVLKPLI